MSAPQLDDDITGWLFWLRSQPGVVLPETNYAYIRRYTQPGAEEHPDYWLFLQEELKNVQARMRSWEATWGKARRRA